MVIDYKHLTTLDIFKARTKGITNPDSLEEEAERFIQDVEEDIEWIVEHYIIRKEG